MFLQDGKGGIVADCLVQRSRTALKKLGVLSLVCSSKVMRLVTCSQLCLHELSSILLVMSGVL